MTTTATPNIITTRIMARDGLALGAFVEAIAFDDDLRTSVPQFIGLNGGIISFTTVGPEAALDGIGYAAMLQAFGLAAPNGTALQSVGCAVLDRAGQRRTVAVLALGVSYPDLGVRRICPPSTQQTTCTAV